MHSWSEGSEVIRTAPRTPEPLLSRFRRWWNKRGAAQAGTSLPAVEAFKVGDRVRIDAADPPFTHRIGVEAIIASELECATDGRMYYRLDNNMSAQPECLTLLEPGADVNDR